MLGVGLGVPRGWCVRFHGWGLGAIQSAGAGSGSIPHGTRGSRHFLRPAIFHRQLPPLPRPHPWAALHTPDPALCDAWSDRHGVGGPGGVGPARCRGGGGRLVAACLSLSMRIRVGVGVVPGFGLARGQRVGCCLELGWGDLDPFGFFGCLCSLSTWFLFEIKRKTHPSYSHPRRVPCHWPHSRLRCPSHCLLPHSLRLQPCRLRAKSPYPSLRLGVEERGWCWVLLAAVGRRRGWAGVRGLQKGRLLLSRSPCRSALDSSLDRGACWCW